MRFAVILRFGQISRPNAIKVFFFLHRAPEYRRGNPDGSEPFMSGQKCRILSDFCLDSIRLQIFDAPNLGEIFVILLHYSYKYRSGMKGKCKKVLCAVCLKPQNL